MKLRTKKENWNDCFRNNRFEKDRSYKARRFYNNRQRRPFVNYYPSLTIVSKERRWEENALKGNGTYHWAVLTKISRNFSSPTIFYLHVRRHSRKLHVIFFNNRFQKQVTTLSIDRHIPRSLGCHWSPFIPDNSINWKKKILHWIRLGGG